MRNKYLEFAKKSFQTNLVYRANCIAGIVNALVMILVSLSIWKAIYEDGDVVDGIYFRQLVTYIVLSFCMQTVFVMDEYYIANKIRSGIIAFDLLKPLNFYFYIFSYNLGALVFRIIVQLLPIVIVAVFAFNILPPFSLTMALFFILSGVLAYFVIYSINYLVWISSFWFYQVFALVTIKDSIIMIFGGALLPLWFMPGWLVNIIRLTPLDAIYYIPISIYLGQITREEIQINLIKQFAWIVILTVCGLLLWNAARRRMVVQGG